MQTKIQVSIPKTVTFKELMIVYGLNPIAARNKLSTIRSVLQKKTASKFTRGRVLPGRKH